MKVTLDHLRPETFKRDWRLETRGAKWLANPLDIMVDVDDVLFPTMMSIHDLAEEAGLHDGTVDPAWAGWEVYTLPGGAPCPPQVYWDLWSDFALADGYLHTPPIEEAAHALRRLYFAGHQIHLVTARGFMNHADEIRRWTRQWIEEFAIPWHTLTFAQDKVAAQADIGATFDHAIDDSPKNVRALADAGVDVYLLTHPHNRSDSWLKRVQTVSEFADIILEETDV